MDRFISDWCSVFSPEPLPFSSDARPKGGGLLQVRCASYNPFIICFRKKSPNYLKNDLTIPMACHSTQQALFNEKRLCRTLLPGRLEPLEVLSHMATPVFLMAPSASLVYRRACRVPVYRLCTHRLADGSDKTGTDDQCVDAEVLERSFTSPRRGEPYFCGSQRAHQKRHGQPGCPADLSIGRRHNLNGQNATGARTTGRVYSRGRIGLPWKDNLFSVSAEPDETACGRPFSVAGHPVCVDRDSIYYRTSRRLRQ